MKHWIWIMAALCACTTGPMMTYEKFEKVHVGTTVGALQDMVGTPFDIQVDEEGVQNYIYIERMEIGRDTTSARTYILKVVNGVVVDKQYKEKTHSVDIKFHS